MPRNYLLQFWPTSGCPKVLCLKVDNFKNVPTELRWSEPLESKSSFLYVDIHVWVLLICVCNMISNTFPKDFTKIPQQTRTCVVDPFTHIWSISAGIPFYKKQTMSSQVTKSFVWPHQKCCWNNKVMWCSLNFQRCHQNCSIRIRRAKTKSVQNENTRVQCKKK